MVSFDFMQQPTGPTVPISLFADAATAGINAGNALPTTTTSIIEGAVKGYQVGQQIREQSLRNEAVQAQVDSIPQRQQITDEQLKQEQQQSEITRLKLEAAKANQEAALNLEQIKTENETAEAKQMAKDIETKREMSEMATGTPEQQASILQNPEYMGVINRYPKFGESILGTIRPNLTDPKMQEQADYLVSYTKKMEEDRLKAASNAKYMEALAKNREKLQDKVQSNGLLNEAIKDVEYSDIPDSIKVYPSGLMQTDDNGMLNEQAQPDSASAAAQSANGMHDLFIDGRKSPYQLDKTQATDLLALKNAIEKEQRVLGIRQAPSTRKQSQPEKKAAVPASEPPATLASLTKTLEQAGVPAKAASVLLDTAVQEGEEQNALQDLVIGTLPKGLADSVTSSRILDELDLQPNIEEIQGNRPEISELRKTLGAGKVTEMADALAAKTLDYVSTGDQTVKEEARDWAKENGLTLNKSSLTKFYRAKLRETMNSVYREGVRIGAENRSLKRNEEAAVATRKAVADAAFEGKGLEERVALKKAKEAYDRDQGIKSGVERAEFGGTGGGAAGGVAGPGIIREFEEEYLEDTSIKDLTDYTPSEKKIITKVQKHPLLEKAPPHVKALAAVESAGNTAAVSKTGVVGVLQVTKKVGRSYNLNVNIPEENIMAGQLYYEDLLKMFNGDKYLAYAAYNAGPSTIKYAMSLAKSSAWSKVKTFMLDALKAMKQSEREGWNPYDKLREVYNYPEKALNYERAWS